MQINRKAIFFRCKKEDRFKYRAKIQSIMCEEIIDGYISRMLLEKSFEYARNKFGEDVLNTDDLNDSIILLNKAIRGDLSYLYQIRYYDNESNNTYGVAVIPLQDIAEDFIVAKYDEIKYKIQEPS